MLVYTKYSSSRVEYIFSTLLNALGITNFKFTSDKIAFSNFTAAKINYSPEGITDYELWVKPVELLFENTIKELQISCFNLNGNKAFFQTSDGDFGFDIFAASFYLISRYEEYLPHKLDSYGRYAHENSLAWREGFLQLPLVNIWLQLFSKKLVEKFPLITLNAASFSFLPTYDIDIAYSYLHKGIKRNLGGFIKSMWHSEWSLFAERLNVLFGKQQDPFDSYEWLDELHSIHHLKPLYFFLLAAKNKDYDRHILPQKKALKKLVQQHRSKYNFGIHPSWQSGDKSELLKQEINTLKRLSGKLVARSRQHYIRMQLPETYRLLIEAGISEDYSMGYGSTNGFRASYCLPYLWYNLQKEKTTNLTIYPFCFMDANAYYEQHYNSEEALQEMYYYLNTVKHVNGLLITIWHNHFLGTDNMFTGWKEIYKEFCQNLDLLDSKD